MGSPRTRLPIKMRCAPLHSTITALIADGVPALPVVQIAGTRVAMIMRHHGRLPQDQAVDALTRPVL